VARRESAIVEGDHGWTAAAKNEESAKPFDMNIAAPLIVLDVQHSLTVARHSRAKSVFARNWLSSRASRAISI
jgi:hypothetical protein